jgi:hypothetical protein
MSVLASILFASVAGLLAAPASPAQAATTDESVTVAVTLNTVNDAPIARPTTVVSADSVAAKAVGAVDGPAATTTSKCRQISGQLRGLNILNQVLWTYQLNGRWCFRSTGLITYRYSDYSVNTSYALWSFDRVISTSQSSTPFIKYQQVQFDHCIPTPWNSICTYDTPWIRLTMNGNGTSRIEGAV